MPSRSCRKPILCVTEGECSREPEPARGVGRRSAPGVRAMRPRRGRPSRRAVREAGAVRPRRRPGRRRSPAGGTGSGRRPASGARAALTLAERGVIGAGFALPRDAGRRPALQAVRALLRYRRYAVSAVARHLHGGRYVVSPRSAGLCRPEVGAPGRPRASARSAMRSISRLVRRALDHLFQREVLEPPAGRAGVQGHAG